MFLQVYSSPPPAQAPARLAREEGSSVQGSCCSILLMQDPMAASLPKPQEIGRPQAPAQVTVPPASLQLNPTGYEWKMCFFCCFSWAEHFFPTKGRGMTGTRTSVPEAGSRTGWVPVGLVGRHRGVGWGCRTAQAKSIPCQATSRHRISPSPTQTLNTFPPFLMCFIHKLPMANS